jgi:hypothetical protein
MGLLLGDWVLHVLRCLAKFVEMVVIQPLIAHRSILALILGRSVLLGRCVISCLGTGSHRTCNRLLPCFTTLLLLYCFLFLFLVIRGFLMCFSYSLL